MPTFNKTVKTRTSKEQVITKIPYKDIREYLETIKKFPIVHDEFVNF